MYDTYQNSLTSTPQEWTLLKCFDSKVEVQNSESETEFEMGAEVGLHGAAASAAMSLSYVSLYQLGHHMIRFALVGFLQLQSYIPRIRTCLVNANP